MAEERVQRALARAGYGSRRACELLISAGRVTIDAQVAVLGDRVDGARQELRVDGRIVLVDQESVYLLLNKPVGVVTTAMDPQGRQTVLDLISSPVRVFPVGRLDRATEGLLLLTNDGRLAHLLTHPSSHVPKEYLVQVSGDPAPGAIRRLREGVELDDGLTSPAQVSRVAPGVLRIVIHEGRNRQVRRMCASVGHDVQRLVRTRIGPIHDVSLAPGAWRPLSALEVRRLVESVGPVGDAPSTIAP